MNDIHWKNIISKIWLFQQFIYLNRISINIFLKLELKWNGDLNLLKQAFLSLDEDYDSFIEYDVNKITELNKYNLLH